MIRKLAPLPHVGNIRGAGLFWGVEFVEDKSTKTPFKKTGFAKKVADCALQMGVQVYVCEGIADGILGDAVIVAPAYTSRIEEIVTIVDVLKSAISASCT